jgi:periplasmic protein CpxP/Spy
MKYRIVIACLAALLLSAISYGQSPQPQAPTPPSSEQPGGDVSGPRPAHHFHNMEMHPMPPMGMPMDGMPMGKWWKNAEIVKELQLSDEQLQRLEQAFQESRLHLIDLHAALEKEEALLEPLTEADNPDESQVDSQIDKVAMARAELEKAHTRMLLNVRKVLTTDQWKKLQSTHFGPMPRMHFPMGPELPAPPPSSGKPQL